MRSAANAAYEYGRKAVKRCALILLLALVVVLAGCAEAYFPGGSGGGTAFALTVSPGSASIPGLNQQQFVAKLGDGSKPAVTWMVNGVVGGDAVNGTIAANGMYTAPEFPPPLNSVTVTATVPSDMRKTGASSVIPDRASLRGPRRAKRRFMVSSLSIRGEAGARSPRTPAQARLGHLCRKWHRQQTRQPLPCRHKSINPHELLIERQHAKDDEYSWDWGCAAPARQAGNAGENGETGKKPSPRVATRGLERTIPGFAISAKCP